MEQKTSIHAEVGQQDLWITRHFDLPAHLVYKAYSEAEFIEQWMGTKVIELHHTDRGSYIFETSYNGQVVFKASGSIHQVVLNLSIVRTFEMHNAAIGAQLEVLTFEAINDHQCTLKIHVIYQSEAHRAEQLKLPFAQGLNMAHDRLEKLTF